MMPRLTSRIVVDALFRRVRAAGGFGTVLARGDDNAGAILVVCADHGLAKCVLENATDLTGNQRWTRCGPQDVESEATRESYIQRRREADPDIWLIELDIPDAERFVAETEPFH